MIQIQQTTLGDWGLNLDNFIDPKNCNLFAAYPVHTRNSMHKKQKQDMSEMTDPHMLVNVRKNPL